MITTEKEYIARYIVRAQQLIGYEFRYEPTQREWIYQFKAKDIKIARRKANVYCGTIRSTGDLPKVKLKTVLERTIDEQIQQIQKKD